MELCVCVCFCQTDNPVYFSEHSGPPSGTSSAKQSPSSQHRAVGQQPAHRDDRYKLYPDGQINHYTHNYSPYSQHTNLLLFHFKKSQCITINYYFKSYEMRWDEKSKIYYLTSEQNIFNFQSNCNFEILLLLLLYVRYIKWETRQSKWPFNSNIPKQFSDLKMWWKFHCE